jgi:hypothetical protein
MSILKINRRNFLTLTALLGLGACATDSGDSDDSDDKSGTDDTGGSIPSPFGGWVPYGSDFNDESYVKTSENSAVNVGGVNSVKPIDNDDRFDYSPNVIPGIDVFYIYSGSGGSSCITIDSSRNYMPSFKIVGSQNIKMPMIKRSNAVKSGNISYSNNDSISSTLFNWFRDERLIFIGKHSLESLCNNSTPLDNNSVMLQFGNNLFSLMSDNPISESADSLSSILGINKLSTLSAYRSNYFLSEKFPLIYLIYNPISENPIGYSNYLMSRFFPIKKGNQWIHSGQTTTILGTENLLGDNFAHMVSGQYESYYGFSSGGFYTSLVGQKDPSNGKYAFLSPALLSQIYPMNPSSITTKIAFLDYPIEGVTMTSNYSCSVKQDLIIKNRLFGDCVKLIQENAIYQNGSQLGTDSATYWLHGGTGPVRVSRVANGTPYGAVDLDSVGRVDTSNLSSEYSRRDFLTGKPSSKEDSFLKINVLPFNFRK